MKTMGGYLDRIKALEQSDRSFVESTGGSFKNSGDRPKQLPVDGEISELFEKRSALLDRLRAGQRWLSIQHHLWLSDNPAANTAAADAEFSRVYRGWWDLDFQLRAKFGLEGCIFAPEGWCTEDFGCIGCVTAPPAAVVAQLSLRSVVMNNPKPVTEEDMEEFVDMFEAWRDRQETQHMGGPSDENLEDIQACESEMNK